MSNGSKVFAWVGTDGYLGFWWNKNCKFVISLIFLKMLLSWIILSAKQMKN